MVLTIQVSFAYLGAEVGDVTNLGRDAISSTWPVDYGLRPLPPTRTLDASQANFNQPAEHRRPTLEAAIWAARCDTLTGSPSSRTSRLPGHYSTLTLIPHPHPHLRSLSLTPSYNVSPSHSYNVVSQPHAHAQDAPPG